MFCLFVELTHIHPVQSCQAHYNKMLIDFAGDFAKGRSEGGSLHCRRARVLPDSKVSSKSALAE